ncbi:MmcQ/YjbR family DNA-binding protein [Nocardioides sp.]|uniref:MmcQ/YjbR family DNA-binding protein n=1 Tax=Nocardioides sp. TaxID=35761 RepID=UPI00271BEA25|nr:MmcQ/YjbR family DNA-binding protein [Nocardioides sp.]MDO9454539.1 MmcQ/YjbR family DNA-binding protein [Nocardioides sp.]
MVRGRPEPDPALVARVASCALTLPEAYEEDAWTGVRWRVRKKTFAHALVTTPDRAHDHYDLDLAGPTPILTFRSSGEELLALTLAGRPFFKPPWSPTVVAMLLGDDTDWDEVGELVTESYRLLAPQKLVARLPSIGPTDSPG